jgi:hypothetical protein
MFPIVATKPLSCIECKTTFSQLDQDSCNACVPRLELGAQMSPQLAYRTALAIMAKHSSAMANQLDQTNFHKAYTFFSRSGDRKLLILPSSKSFNKGARRYLATLTPQRRADHFWAHCFALGENDPTSGQLISIKGNVVNIISGSNGPAAVEHMGQQYPILSYYRTENGNHCYIVSGIPYPYLLLSYTNPLFVWHPFLYLFNLVECSNFMQAFRKSRLHDAYTENCRETFTLLLPRNDTFTAECLEFLSEPSDLERFVKNHIIKGYVSPATNEAGDTLETLRPIKKIVTEFGTELFVQSVLDGAGVVQKVLAPLRGILAKARIIHSFTLARGMLLVIDRPLDEFPDELTIVPSSQ